MKNYELVEIAEKQISIPRRFHITGREELTFIITTVNEDGTFTGKITGYVND